MWCDGISMRPDCGGFMDMSGRYFGDLIRQITHGEAVANVERYSYNEKMSQEFVFPIYVQIAIGFFYRGSKLRFDANRQKVEIWRKIE